MTEIHLPSYTEIARALSKTSLQLHPSEVHGLICGLFCSPSDFSSQWEEWVTGDKSEHSVLRKLYTATQEQLKDESFNFQLLLPSDDDELPERAEALTLWSQGFLTGLKYAKVTFSEQESHEAAEAVNDITEIAKMNYENVIASEEDEKAYFELVEYVRMAVILIYQDEKEKAGADKQSKPNKHLH